VAVVVFPGSNDDRDAAWALHAVGAEPVFLWHDTPTLPRGVRAAVVPGGFSYGDYLRCGAIARFAPAMKAVRELAECGAPVLGICNGFQILCEAGLLPGALLPNLSLSFVCRDVGVRVERTDTPFTARCRPAQCLTLPVKHGHGRFYAPPDAVAELARRGQIVLRYERNNPNGSIDGIAGVVNEAGNVMGVMPHPEHAVDPLLGSADGALLVASLVDSARRRALAAA
jgi:phosphoribosylformylglycinamidine synthase